MKLKCFFILIIFFLCKVTQVFSQAKIVEITVLMQGENQKKPEPKAGVHVYGFYDVAKANKFMASAENDIAFDPRPGEHFDVYAQTDNEGYCEMELTPIGAVVIRPEFGSPKMQEINGKFKHTIEIKDVGRVMGEVVQVAKMKRMNKSRPARRFGNRLVFGPHSFYLNSEQTYSNARTGLAPIVTTMTVRDSLLNIKDKLVVDIDSILVPLDTFMIARPFIKDGEAYQKTQKRRMGFDEKNDPLIAYRSLKPMVTREEDSISVYLVLYPIEKDKHYRINATHWFENYHNVYFSDSVCLAEGLDKDPMRFLDYNLIQIPIDTLRYRRKGRREKFQDKRKLNLNFMVGKAELDPTDSLNFVQLNQLKEDLARFANSAESAVFDIVVHGQASPDGGIAINQRLCNQRAEYLKSQIASSFPELRSLMTATASVAGWEDVARLLEEDSLMDYANEVKEIIASNKNTQVQERKIRALPYYDLIREKILPQLRVVDFSFSYVTNRILSPDEVYQRYLTDPGYRSGKKLKPYEFYHLLRMIKEPKELEVLAHAAWKSVKDDDQKNPWPLAAYVLGQCYLQRGVADTTLFKPYLDWRRAGYPKPEAQMTNSEGYKLNYVNDPAIVTAHIMHLCKAGDYYMADSVAANLLPDEPRFFMMKRFLDCLNGEYNDPFVRDTVASTSVWNKVVLYAAQDAEGQNNASMHRTALYLLKNDTVNFDQEDPKVLYMIATLRFRLEGPKNDAEIYSEHYFEKDEFADMMFSGAGYGMEDDQTAEDWGLPMIECCLKDEKYLKYMLFDGEFNSAYRKTFLKAWKKMKSEKEQENVENFNADETKQ